MTLLENKIAVCIPAFNEELLIGKVIENIPSFVDLIVVIDDASTDATSETVKRSFSHMPLIRQRIRNITQQDVGVRIIHEN